VSPSLFFISPFLLLLLLLFFVHQLCTIFISFLSQTAVFSNNCKFFSLFHESLFCVKHINKMARSVHDAEIAEYQKFTGITRVQWSNLGYSIGTKKLLSSIYGDLNGGEMLAIMGPSGCGKTTFMTSLVQRISMGTTGSLQKVKQTGHVAINTHLQPHKKFKRSLAYVRQEDIFLPYLTVFQTLLFTAQLRMPASIPHEKKIERVRSVIHDLGLTACAHTLVGDSTCKGISGGQKRRLSMGVELITDPSFLLCDEPTSGLDSVASARLVRTLKAVAAQGKMVMCTIHQPSSTVFNMFDKLLLLSEGRAIYYGPVNACIPYFNTIGYTCEPYCNPADFIMELIARVDNTYIAQSESVPILSSSLDAVPGSPAHLDNVIIALDEASRQHVLATKYELFRTRSERETSSARNSGTAPSTVVMDPILFEAKWDTSWWSQFQTLVERSMIQIRREMFDVLYIIQTITISVICCCLWFRRAQTAEALPDQLSAMFFIVGYWSINPMIAALVEYPSDKNIVQRERFSGSYRLSAYYVSKMITEIPKLLLYPTIFFIPFYWVIGLLASASAFFTCWILLILNVFCAKSWGEMIASTGLLGAKGITLASVIGMGMLLLQGFYVRFDNIPIWFRWLSYPVFQRYTFAGISQTQLMHRTFESHSTSENVNGNHILTQYSLDQVSVWTNAVILICMTCTIRVISYAFMRRSLKVKE
jgi:ABC-type multidrug transport system ATPase subunit/ABC-type multidrug transport system permease subunit